MRDDDDDDGGTHTKKVNYPRKVAVVAGCNGYMTYSNTTATQSVGSLLYSSFKQAVAELIPTPRGYSLVFCKLVEQPT